MFSLRKKKIARVISGWKTAYRKITLVFLQRIHRKLGKITVWLQNWLHRGGFKNISFLWVFWNILPPGGARLTPLENKKLWVIHAKDRTVHAAHCKNLMSDAPPQSEPKAPVSRVKFFSCSLVKLSWSQKLLTDPTINVTHMFCRVQTGYIPQKRALRVAEWRNTSILAFEKKRPWGRKK